MAKNKRTRTGKTRVDTVAAALNRNRWPIAGAIAAGLGALGGLLWARSTADDRPAGHAAPDLDRDDRPAPTDRAEPHFRPDIDAPMSAADRAALAPALISGSDGAGQAAERVEAA